MNNMLHDIVHQPNRMVMLYLLYYNLLRLIKYNHKNRIYNNNMNILHKLKHLDFFKVTKNFNLVKPKQDSEAEEKQYT